MRAGLLVLSAVRVTGPLAEFATGFAEELGRLGYTELSARNQVRLLAHLSRWMETQELVPAQLTRMVLERFLEARRGTGYTCWLSERGLRPLVTYLVRSAAMPAFEVVTGDSPVERLLDAYGRHLLTERGIKSSTIAGYRSAVRPFLEQRVHGDRLELGGLKAADVTRFVLRAVDLRQEVGSAKHLVTALRSLLRYLHLEGMAPDLAAAVPAVAGWRGGYLPRGLEPQQVTRMLAACDRDTVVGRRDYAMLMLLARLGLRRGEVAALKLDDLDWRHGELVIRGKGDRQERLPLPADVGEAISAYLLQGRPRVPSRRVFVSVRAPFGDLTSVGVGHVVGSACDQAGMARFAAHRLRHTVATELLRAGAGLPDVGQILRHRHLSTTAIYAKVDRAALRALAEPWPGDSTDDGNRAALRGLARPWPGASA